MFRSTIPPPWRRLLRFLLIAPSVPLPPSHSAQPARSDDLLPQNKLPQNLAAEIEIVIYFAHESATWTTLIRDISAPCGLSGGSPLRLKDPPSQRFTRVHTADELMLAAAQEPGWGSCRGLWVLSVCAPRWL